MRRIGVLIIILIGSIASASTLSEDLEALRQKHRVPAIGLAIIDQGKIKDTVVTGIRSVEHSTPVDIDDRWHLGSNTKAMTATLVAKLIATGKYKLSWDTTLAESFPEIKVHDDLKEVSIRDLLAHRGGIVEDITSLDKGELWMKIWGPRISGTDGRYLVTHALLTRAPEYKPKEKMVYSNAGYMIVGAILERRTQESWEDLLRNEIFRPLSMHNCGFGAAGSSGRSKPDEPWGHTYDGDQIKAVPPGRLADNPPAMGPAGRVHCSLGDWARFALAHLLANQGEKTPVLSPAGFKELHRDYDGQGYTPGGWVVRKSDKDSKPTLWHTGSNTMNYAFISLNMDAGQGVLVTTNMGDVQRAEALFQDALALAAKALAEDGKANSKNDVK